MDNKICGAYFKVYIKSHGSISDIGSKLKIGLKLPVVRYENREDEPYDLLGYAEVLGFEMQLEEIKNDLKWPSYGFILTATTMDSFEEELHDQMHNISHWMARYISLTCDMTTMAENHDKVTGQLFCRNKSTFERETSLVEAKA